MHIHQQTLKPQHTSVSVLMLRWEEDTSAEPDMVALEKVFRERYNYQTERWTIPTVLNPSVKLGVRMASFLDSAGPDNLLIIYYAGHAYVGQDDKLYWACNPREDAAKLKWDGVRCLFEDAQSEILLLLDSCAVRDAPLAGRHGAKQAIAAFSPDQTTREPGPRSFTATLAEALHRLSHGRPFSAQRLHEEVVHLRQQEGAQALARLPNGNVKSVPPPPPEKVPVFFNLTPAKGQGIIMVPLDADGAHLQSPPQSAEADSQNWKGAREDRPLNPEEVVDLTFDEARVLVCTTFVGEASPDMVYFNQWLHNTPPVASKITVEGMFLGPPTMLLISMPLSIWNIVQHDKVCCFLGYITSHNMIHLYQRLVSSASAGLPPTHSKEVEDGRILLEAREAAAGSPSIARRDTGNHFTPVSKGPQRRLDTHTPVAATGSTPVLHQVSPSQMPVTNTNANEEVEDSAEMKEAAEQLKALSHVRHMSDDNSPCGLDRQSAGRVGDSIAVRHADDPGSSPDANESAIEEIHYGGANGAEFGTPSAKTKARRPLQKQTPKQETRCSHCSHAPFKDSSSLRKHIAAAHTRPFPCAFSFAGCISTFGSKNEWKRHIASQHLCLQYYRCSSCPQTSGADGKGNEFNRKDLFTQHLRRMHAPFAIKKALKGDAKLQAEWEGHVKDMQTSCLVTRRQPPQRSACPKEDCQTVFEGAGSWDEWTEHVGRHMEKGEAGRMGVDKLLAKWALDEGIIERVGGPNEEKYRLTGNSGLGVVTNGNGMASGGNAESDAGLSAIEHANGNGSFSLDDGSTIAVGHKMDEDPSITVAFSAPASASDGMDVD